jgi:hypothetical protein
VQQLAAEEQLEKMQLEKISCQSKATARPFLICSSVFVLKNSMLT